MASQESNADRHPGKDHGGNSFDNLLFPQADKMRESLRAQRKLAAMVLLYCRIKYTRGGTKLCANHALSRH